MNTLNKETYHKTVVVATMLCCGKTFLCTNNATNYLCIDLDSIVEPKQSALQNKYRHSCNVKKYMLNIKHCFNKYDFIFVAAKPELLKALSDLSIAYVLVYPKQTSECYNEWGNRNKLRNTEWLWEYNKRLFYTIIHKLKNDSNALHHYELSEDQYLSDIINQIYSDCFTS